MTDRITQHQGKVTILSADHEHQVMQFDCAHDLAEFIVALVAAGQKTFPECNHASIHDATHYDMKSRVNGWHNDTSQWAWRIQKQKKDDSATGIEK